MIDCGEGGIIFNIGFIGLYMVLFYLIVYCMLKVVVVMMIWCFVWEWVCYMINVNVLCFGYIEMELNSDWFVMEKGKVQVMGYLCCWFGLELDLDGVLFFLCFD